MSFMARLRALERDTPASVGVTPGTAHGNSSLVLDSAKDATGIGNLSGTKWTGNVTGILTGNSTGVHTGNVAGNVAGAVGNFTGNVTGGNLSIGGVAAVTGNLSGGNISSAGACAITGNLSGGNISTAGIVAATGNVSGGNITSGGAAVITGNVSGGNVTTAGAVAATGNVSGGNVTTGGLVSATGNVSGGNITSAGAAVITGNISGGNITANAGGYHLHSVSNAISGAGTVQGNATALTSEVNRVTTAASGTGVKLPAAVVGMRVNIDNQGANALKVYGNGSDTVDGQTGSTGVTLTNAKRADFFCVAAATWTSQQMGVVSA